MIRIGYLFLRLDATAASACIDVWDSEESWGLQLQANRGDHAVWSIENALLTLQHLSDTICVLRLLAFEGSTPKPAAARVWHQLIERLNGWVDPIEADRAREVLPWAIDALVREHIVNTATSVDAVAMIDGISQAGTGAKLEADDAKREWLLRQQSDYQQQVRQTPAAAAAEYLASLCTTTTAHASAAPTPATAPTFRKNGDVWELAYQGGKRFQIKDMAGLRSIAMLLQHPRQEIDALELRGQVSVPVQASAASAALLESGLQIADWGASDAVLDDRARREYADRLQELSDERQAAHQLNDEDRLNKIDAEEDFIESELRRHTGLAGRKRAFSSEREKARSNVTQQIQRAVAKIGMYDRALEDHLKTSIRTGNLCGYFPQGELPRWDL